VRLNFPKKTLFFKDFFSSNNGKRICYSNILFLKRECLRKKGENCLKRLILKNVAFIQIQRVAIYDWDRKKSI